MNELIAIWIFLPTSIVLVVSGLMAYFGKYTAWLLLKSVFPGWPGLAGLYLGWAFLGVFGYAAISRLGISFDAPFLVDLLVLVYGVSCVASFPVGIIGFFWLPRFMLPKWIKETEEKMARGEDKLSQALRPGGKLYGRLGQPKANAPRKRADGDRNRIE